MPLTIGSHLGSHEITALLGKGGMGEVYRARDLKLKREVAIKILPGEFAQDSDRVSRFQREAEVLASLNHPNIAAIHDLEETGGTRYLVLELVEGETLAGRLVRGPIPLDEAVQVAKQIVDALEAAHERGIVHRDLKPGNIKIGPDGKVKVLDFGLAKVASPLPAAEGFSNSPTLVSGSIAGVILGTAPYMSPEQARGKVVDARTDIWAFGCVLYEMLTREQAFTGETTTDVLAKVLEAQPKWDALPAETPSSIRFLLETALNKDPKQRLQHIGDVRPLLNRPATLDKSASATSRPRRNRRGWLITAVLATAVIAALVPEALYFLRAPEAKTAMRVEIATPGMLRDFPAISPDGQYVAYTAAQADGKSAIWIRPMGGVQARPLAGTENGTSPFWSPDSRNIAFVADGKLKKISAADGPATTLVETSSMLGAGTWNRDGVILATSIPPGMLPTIVRISAESGGVVAPAGTHRDGFGDVLPEFLPDGRHFLYVLIGPPTGTAELYAGSLDGGTPVHIVSQGNLNFVNETDLPARYAAPGYLLWVRNGILTAQRFDEKRLALAGDPVSFAEPAGPFSVSQQEMLVYRPISAQGTVAGAQEIVWMDRKGTRGQTVGMPGLFSSLRLSRDGRRLALNWNNQGNTDIWVIDLDRGIPNRVTTDPAVDEYPGFSPDGKQIVFASRRLGGRMFTAVSLGTDQPLPAETPSGMRDFPEDWSQDTKYIIFLRTPLSITSSDIWVKPMFGDGRPFPFIQSKSFEYGEARVSPDGHWLAYMTNESGTSQIVVQTFPHPSENKIQVTARGGRYPTWRGVDGRELYYLALDGKLMAVSVKQDGDKLVFGEPTALFQSPLRISPVISAHQYDVNKEGTRFIFIADNNNSATPNDSAKLSVIVNWTAALHKK